MKPILFEQLPPELLAMYNTMNDEIKELKRMIEEGDINMGVSEAEFNTVKLKVAELEQGVLSLQKQITDLNIDPVQLQGLFQNVATLTQSVEGLSSYDTSNSQLVSALTERITTIETKHVSISLEQLNLPSTTTTNITLPLIDDLLTTFVWSSSHPQYISQTGIVKRPSATEGNVSVVLTVDATYGTTVSNKTFVISVTAAEMTDAERLDVVTANLDESIFIGSVVDTEVFVTESQTLPSLIENVAITWESSNPIVFANDGTVTRPTGANETVMLTATLTFNAETRTKIFNIVVEKQETVVEPEPPVEEETP